MTRLRLFIALGASFLVLGTGTGAAVAVALSAASGPPISSPAASIGPFYSGPVHQCWSTADESVAYLEERTTAQGNCARGYVQLTVNELTPRFTLQLPAGPVLACTAATAAAETALTCSSPSPSPSASPSSSPSSSPTSSS